MALPYIEQGALYQSINFEVPGGGSHQYGWQCTTAPGANNLSAAQVILNALLCPSNPQDKKINGQSCGIFYEAYANEVARTDYTGSMGFTNGGWRDCPRRPIGTGPWSWTDQGGPTQGGNGIFGYRGAVTIAQIIDGTSNTVLLVEDMHWRQWGDKNSIHDDAAWANPLAGITSLQVPINYRDIQDDRRCHGWSSLHTGGAQAALCDGSVRFVSENIDGAIQRGIATRGGSEVVDF